MRREDYSRRFGVPNGQLDFESRYDFASQEVQDLAQRKPKPFFRYELDLSFASTTTLVIPGAGRGFVLFGYRIDTKTTIKTVETAAIVHVRVNEDLPECEWTAKHNRGYRGDFDRLFLTWPTQFAEEEILADFYIFKFDGSPYRSGEAAT